MPIRVATNPLRVSLLLTLLLLLPSSTATWYSHGSHEPDSAYDQSTFMWQEPPGEARYRVYFNVYVTQAETGFNPNVGTLQTRFETFGTEDHEAVLGVWIDCNDDGYVGLAETAAREYPAQLLLDTARCPAVSGPASKWSQGAHNYNQWVTELVPIGPRLGGSADARWYPDQAAMVWGDQGRPDGTGTRPTCALTSLPPGGSRSTGRILDHADCYLTLLAEESSAGAYRSAYAQATDAAGQDLLGLALTSERWGGSAHPLDIGTFGDADASNSYVSAHECDTIQVTGDTPIDELDETYVHEPTTPSVNDDGSIAGTFVYADEFVHQNDWNEPNALCGRDAVEDDRQFYGYLEGDEPDVYGSVKSSPNWLFRFYRAARGASPVAAIPAANLVSGFGGSAGAASDLGLEVLPAGFCGAHSTTNPSVCAQTGWYGDATQLRALPSILRADLGRTEVDFAHAYVQTFYATWGADTGARGFHGPGGTGSYGAATCGSNDAGVHGGWECDAEAWYPDQWCNPYVYHCDALPRPGTTYRMRDVDCYDGRVLEGSGVGVLPPYYGASPCPGG